MVAALLALALQTAAEPAHGRKLVFAQDFTKVERIDPKKWLFDDGPVYNHEAETYTKADHGNARIENGALVIEARREDSKITSARLESVKAWEYPFVEVVAKVPKGKGTWPAIWMLNDRLRQKNGGVGWPEAGEIDIMENVGYDPPNFHFSLHCGKYNWMRKEQRTKIVASENPNDYHRFGMDCRPNHIEFYLDGKPAYTVDNTEKSFDAWPFGESFYLILNLAIGGDWGGKEGIDDSIFPCRYLIKSVKIYQ